MHAEKSEATKGSKIISLKTDFGGEELTIETGKLALLADGSVTMRYGDTVVLATVVLKKEADTEKDYFPLSVEFQDKWYATGKISGSRFIKREARPSELAMLRSRMIDRPIRPMFPEGFMNETQIIVTPLSYDYSIDPAVLGLAAASAALMITGAPFEGPVGAVRIGRIDGKLKVNPTNEEMEVSDLELLVAGTEEAITMIEGGGKQIPENELEEALSFAHKSIQPVIEVQKKLVKEFNVKPMKYDLVKAKNDLYEEISKYLSGKLGESVRHKDKIARNTLIAELEDNVLTYFADKFEEAEISQAFESVIKEEVRRSILEEGNRPDHRKFDEIRALSSETGVLPRTHGSALFQRGQTQILSTVTLASPSKAQLVESMDQDFSKKYMHHYVDTPASYGETGRIGAGRRAIGHGFLAERALEAVLPQDSVFPYTIRVVSEILSCNGSSSMGSVCGSSLALMDAGVPITDSVAGIAMGLITTDSDLSKKYVILTDIQGAEDFAGDMDFKLAGTRKGTTAIQMDIKVKGLTIKFLAEVIKRSKEARIQILDVMDAAISKPNAELSKYAPRLTTIKIDKDKIREVIGKGGETINRIIAETGAEIDIEDDGTVVIAAADGAASEAALKMIKDIVMDPEPGTIYDGKVVKIMDFGAFVEFLPGKEGLVHISQLAEHRVEKVEDEVKEGEVIRVKLIKKDDQGRYNLSRKEAK